MQGASVHHNISTVYVDLTWLSQPHNRTAAAKNHVPHVSTDRQTWLHVAPICHLRVHVPQWVLVVRVELVSQLLRLLVEAHLLQGHTQQRG
jgi:hypothetical protein